jgi:heat shock 70kDa protein 4
MVGEATRIPQIQERSKEVFGVEQVNRTLNSLECFARGASLQSAMLSPLFKVAEYEVQEYNLYPVSISYQFTSQGAEAKVITKDLFGLGSTFPSTKSITFDNKKGGMELLVHYQAGVQLLPGLPT